RARCRPVVDLGRDHELVACDQLPQQPTGGGFARAVRVHVGGVEEGEAAFGGAADDGFGLRLIEHPGPVGVVAVAHHSESEPRDVQAGGAEPDLVNQAALRGGATPAITSPIPARSTAVGSCRRTTTPTAVAVAGSSATKSAYVPRASRAIASWSKT